MKKNTSLRGDIAIIGMTVLFVAYGVVGGFAAAVVTDTPAWGLEIQKHLGVAPERLHVVPLGIAEPRPCTTDQIGQARRFCGLGDERECTGPQLSWRPGRCRHGWRHHVG